jgi:hypothetical protein
MTNSNDSFIGNTLRRMAQFLINDSDPFQLMIHAENRPVSTSSDARALFRIKELLTLADHHVVPGISEYSMKQCCIADCEGEDISR